MIVEGCSLYRRGSARKCSLVMVTPKPDALKFLMLIPQSQLLCRDVADISKHKSSKPNDVGAVIVAVGG